MPKLTVRSLAEMIYLPMSTQMRILHEQKYPKEAPNIFKVPFYKPALDTIRDYYRNGNEEKILENWIKKESSLINIESKRINNVRVISSFLNHKISKRSFSISNSITSHKIVVNKNIELKLTFDIEAKEKDNNIFLFFNFRQNGIEEKIAKDTLQIAYWLLKENKKDVPINCLEFVDIFSGNVWQIKRPSLRTINNMKKNLAGINALWEGI